MSEERKYLISEETAQEQIDLFMDYYDVELEDLEGLDGEVQLSSVNYAIRKLKRAIRRGDLTISIEDGKIKIEQKLKLSGDTLTYQSLSGKTKTAVSKGNNYQRMYSLMGSLSGVGEAGISRLEGTDLSVVESLSLLFLLV